MAQVRIKSFSSRSTKEDASEYKKTIGIVYQQPDAIVRIKRSQNGKIIGQMNKAENGQHSKPTGHDRTKKFSDKGCSELLNKEENAEDRDDDIYDGCLRDIRECRNLFQTFYSRCNSDRGR